MMAEVLFRRFRHTPTSSSSPSKGEEVFWPKPDLILLDGGQGHLNMVQKVLRELKLEIPLVAVAKGQDRKKQVLSRKYKANKEIDNILNNKNLLKNIMDEAHRFAIAYHRKVRKKGFLK